MRRIRESRACFGQEFVLAELDAAAAHADELAALTDHDDENEKTTFEADAPTAPAPTAPGIGPPCINPRECLCIGCSEKRWPEFRRRFW